jgi:hypothetical protein
VSSARGFLDRRWETSRDPLPTIASMRPSTSFTLPGLAAMTSFRGARSRVGIVDPRRVPTGEIFRSPQMRWTRQR